MRKHSKIKLITKELLQDKIKRDFEIGGLSEIIISPPGEGKTNFLIDEAKAVLTYHPDEICFWRDNPKSAVQYNKQGVLYNILVEQGIDISFRNKTSGGPINVKYGVFKTMDDIINKDTLTGLAEKHKLNVIYFKNEYVWIDFLQHLRSCVGWQSVFIDEIEDLIPLNPPKKKGEERNVQYEKNLEFAANFKELRKDWVNFFCNTQDLADIDHRVRRKTNYIVYLHGARVEKASKVNQAAVSKLPKGKGFLEWEHSKYGKVDFSYYPNRTPYFEVIIK